MKYLYYIVLQFCIAKNVWAFNCKVFSCSVFMWLLNTGHTRACFWESSQDLQSWHLDIKKLLLNSFTHWLRRLKSRLVSLLLNLASVSYFWGYLVSVWIMFFTFECRSLTPSSSTNNELLTFDLISFFNSYLEKASICS